MATTLREQLFAHCPDVTAQTPPGGELWLNSPRVLLLLQGQADIFVARRRADGKHGRAYAAGRRLTEGCLIPPVKPSDSTLFFVRFLPGSEFAELPCPDLGDWLKHNVWAHESLAAFAAATDGSAVTVEAFLQSFEAWRHRACNSPEAQEELATAMLDQHQRETVRLRTQIGTAFNRIFNRAHPPLPPPDPAVPARTALAAAAALCGVEPYKIDLPANLPPPGEERLSCYAEAIRLSAGSQGIRVRRIELATEWYREEFLPMAVFSADGESAYTVFRWRDESLIRDGATGIESRLDAAKAATLSRSAWNFIRPFPAGPLTPARLAGMALIGGRRDLRGLVVFMLICTLLGLAAPIINSMIFSDVIPNADRPLLWQLFLLSLSFAMTICVLDYVESAAVQCLRFRGEWVLQSALWDRLLRLPANFFSRYTPGDLSVRALGFLQMSEMFTSATIKALGNGVFSLPALLLMFYYAPAQAWLICILLLFILIFFTIVATLQIRRQQNIVRQHGELNGILIQFLDGLSKLRAAGARDSALAIWAAKYADQKELYRQYAFLRNTTTILGALIPSASFLAIAGVTVWQYSNADTTLKAAELIRSADFVGFVSAATLFSSGVTQMLISAQNLLSVIPLYRWMKPLLEAEPEGSFAASGSVQPPQGRVELEHVSFSYDGKTEVLHDVSIRALPGEFIAITGESGSGKSTLLRLLLGFERPGNGAVLYDGEDILHRNLDVLRSGLGVVLQNAGVLPDTVLRNIIGYSPKLTVADAWRAAEQAGCADEIRAFPMQMNTTLAGFGAISGGQRQRILIARALARDPKLLLFDEATSALDNVTQRRIVASLRRLQTTKIVIAHRLSSIADADRIYVLKNGRVIEEGNYETLMAARGYFFRLAERQQSHSNEEGILR